MVNLVSPLIGQHRCHSIYSLEKKKICAFISEDHQTNIKMFFSFRFVIFFSLINLIDLKQEDKNEVNCVFSRKALDQSYRKKNESHVRRPKRFVLFPEFELWLNDWRFLNHPKEFRYWISNYYPQKINTNTVRLYIHQILNDINQVLDYQIHSIQQARSANLSNFNFNFFNYEICPNKDSKATIENVTNVETLLIYPRKLIHQNRYRAHGGMSLLPRQNSTRSMMKFNVHHEFQSYIDFQYDPVIYVCRQNESICTMDLYATMLHEILHGFGIEVDFHFQFQFSIEMFFKHTEKNLPNKNMRAVMHLYASRIMCHDDIRAIRKVYNLTVTRENAKYDDTCRRDFPLNKLQKLMRKFHRSICFYFFKICSSISFSGFLLTIVYLILRKRYFHGEHSESGSSLSSNDSQQSYRKQHKSAINAFLWHGEVLNH